MTIKLNSAIQSEHWYPAGRTFTEAEARIDLLLSGVRVDTSNPTYISSLATRWQWMPSHAKIFLEELMKEGFFFRDWILKEDDSKGKRRLAQEVIEIFNSVFDRRIQLNDFRIRMINGRIKEGKSLKPPIGAEQFKAVFEFKKKEWENTEQERYLTIETLCAAKHFLAYLDAARLDYKKSKQKPEAGVRISGSMFR